MLQNAIPEKISSPSRTKVIVSLLSKERLLKLIRYYILYDNNVKKIARYQQFFGVENTMRRIKGQDDKNTRSGVIWHTQGSGKSLTMVMLVKRIFADKEVKNPRFVLVCDRINLVKQLKDNFIHTGLNPASRHYRQRDWYHCCKIAAKPSLQQR
jgi:type I restriction enzyme R subunit